MRGKSVQCPKNNNAGKSRRLVPRRRVGLLQRLEPQALRRGVVAHAALLVFLVLAVVALEELHVRVAFEGDDVRGDHVVALRPSGCAEEVMTAGQVEGLSLRASTTTTLAAVIVVLIVRAVVKKKKKKIKPNKHN